MRQELKRTVLINVGIIETRIATIADSVLQELTIEPSREAIDSVSVGGIYLGRITRIVDGIQAAFVKIAQEHIGFLSARDAQPHQDSLPLQTDVPLPIKRCVQEGQALLVQVTKEARGTKGPRLSTNITLPGRFLVLAPFQRSVAVSRRIANDAEREKKLSECEYIRERLRSEIGLECGLIMRTAGAVASMDELMHDAENLAENWLAFQDEVPNLRPPIRLDVPIDPVARALRDNVSQDSETIVIDDDGAFASACTYTERLAPDLRGRLERHGSRQLLFDAWGIEEQIEELLSPRVELPSGGWITIEPTEALTAIDVNSGSLDHQSGQAQTALRTNLEAAREVARQVRLRGIAGLVVVDHIHMDDPRHRLQVTAVLSDALGDESTSCQIGEISEFGTLEFTRKRVRRSLRDQVTETAGLSRPQLNFKAVASRLFREIEREANRNPGQALRTRLADDLAQWLENQGAEHFSRLRFALGVEISFNRRNDWPRDRYEIHASG